MAQRWLQQKEAADQRRRARKAGRHDRFHGWTREVTQEKAERVGRALELRDKPIDTTAMVAAYLEGKTINRIACKGIAPQGGYRNGACRKARGGPVELWTGSPRSNGRMPNATGRGLIHTNAVYDREAVWAIVKR